ncbi:Phosphatidylethanolamine N-methyltransferase [Frankliniella fusca]|uniref:Phosphatidylethanolamine N-methyltransferase n=1 Tax=Frankliniella fusca TaxID=407009 RepID=A0AAE1LSL0_9NEOP|nr:Phosphatidylethanolamine N-methyltransferase [Frankliniella fusca]
MPFAVKTSLSVCSAISCRRPARGAVKGIIGDPVRLAWPSKKKLSAISLSEECHQFMLTIRSQ